MSVQHGADRVEQIREPLDILVVHAADRRREQLLGQRDGEPAILQS